MKYQYLLENCKLCGRYCGVNRIIGEKGYCNASDTLRVSSITPHHGEEPIISGFRGSGTIFFSNCSLKCIFCQNYQISHLEMGKTISIRELVVKMLMLENQGCHNINLVTPTHYVPQILTAIELARSEKLSIPIVYNTGGYDDIEIIKQLSGYIDIYMPDFKFIHSTISERLCNSKNYSEIVKQCLKEMYNQVGNIELDENGIATKGLLIRHLVLPGQIENSIDIISWIKENLSNEVSISLMSQYHPSYKANETKNIDRFVDIEDYSKVVEHLIKSGFENGYIQDLESAKEYLPDFIKHDNPFV